MYNQYRTNALALKIVDLECELLMMEFETWDCVEGEPSRENEDQKTDELVVVERLEANMMYGNKKILLDKLRDFAEDAKTAAQLEMVNLAQTSAGITGDEIRKVIDHEQQDDDQ